MWPLTANGTNRVDAYSLLEAATCPTTEDHHKVERTIFGEIVQMKKDRTVPVLCCTVIESVMSQYIGFNSADGVVLYLTFREMRRVEVQECRAAKEKGKMAMGGQEFRVTPGRTISHSTFLHGDLTDGSFCETGVLELSGRRNIGGQATQAIYEITVLEDYAKLNDLTGTITMASGISAKVGDLSLTDSVEGTYVWTHLEEECPRTLVQLYRWPIKIFSSSNTLEVSLALMEDKIKEQVAGLELGKCSCCVGLPKKIRQVRHEICQNRRKTAEVRLEAIAGADDPYSLLQVLGRGHVITKSGAMTYVTRCNPVEVLPRVSSNCIGQIPVTWNNTSPYVDPISYVIKSAASPTRCNNIAPPRWKM